MPWTIDDPPPPARNRSRADRARCVVAANKVLREGGWQDLGDEARKELEQKAVFACIGAMGEQMADSFYVQIEKSLDDVLIFPIGSFTRAGQLRDFTRADAEEMVRNFRDNVLERDVPVNREHDRPAGRVGRVTRLWVADDGVRGEIDVDSAVREKFRYVSPELPPGWKWTNPDDGKVHRNVLMGLALTNYPFFKGKMSLWADGAWETYMDEDVIPLHDTEAIVKAYQAYADSLGETVEQLSDDDKRDALRPFVHEVPVVRLDEAQRVAYGIVLQPDVADAQGHVMSAAEIEAACHRYMERQALDEHHAEDVAPQDARVVECWIQREPVTWRYGERETEVLPGSWCMAVKFYADELWAQVVEGEITGFSPKGWGRLSPVAAE